MAIGINTGFQVNTGLPIDSRQVLTKNEMLNTNDNIMPIVYFGTCSDDGQFYIYNKTNEVSSETGRWRQFGGSSSMNIVGAVAVDAIDINSNEYQYLLTNYTIHKIISGVDTDVSSMVYVDKIEITEAQYATLPEEEKNKDYVWYVH